MADTLASVLAATDKTTRRERDPVQFAHRYSDPCEVEVAGVLASSLAFGNVTTILAKVEEVLQRVGGPAGVRKLRLRQLQGRLDGFVHRVYGGDDVARLLFGVAEAQRHHGSLAAVFRGGFEEAVGEGADQHAREAAAALVDVIRLGAGWGTSEGRRNATLSRGASHLLPDPRSASACKRLHLFLRWMVRPADGIDLGVWEGIPTSVLTMPLDVHIHRIAGNLGLTDRTDVSYRTARSITEALAAIDPVDPVRFDFALCHLGMVGSCLSKRDEVACDGCGVKPVCRHWAPPRRTSRRRVAEAPVRTRR